MPIADEKFIGLHKLSGVDFGAIKMREEYYDDANVMYFIIDGVTYAAIEDPQDGYRSCMEDIVESDHKVKNRFRAQKVFGILRTERYGNQQDVIDMYDAMTGKIVLSFGTRDADDYYPTYVAEFSPENMAINADRQPDDSQ